MRAHLADCSCRTVVDHFLKSNALAAHHALVFVEKALTIRVRIDPLRPSARRGFHTMKGAHVVLEQIIAKRRPAPYLMVRGHHVAFLNRFPVIYGINSGVDPPPSPSLRAGRRARALMFTRNSQDLQVGPHIG